MLSHHFEVTLYEKGKTIGRKYLVAGKGGFNLAHQLDRDSLYQKYTPKNFLKNAIQNFGVKELRNWYQELGIETFVGSSGRIFPKEGISPADVLRAIKTRLKSQGVEVKTQHELVGFDQTKRPVIRSKGENINTLADYYIFSLGGGSWKVTGANAEWLPHFENIGISTQNFEASNCGLNIEWNKSISDFHIGKPLKNIAIYHKGKSIKGEALITRYGLEGNAIYPVSSWVRETINQNQKGVITIDFKPQLTEEIIYEKIKNIKPKNFSKALHLNAQTSSIIKTYTSKEQFLNAEEYAKVVKNIAIPVNSLRPVEEAISTIGGIEIENLNPDFSLKTYPNLFCIGEMVNWDAPTGGFLLQGCFSMGAWVSKELIAHKKAD